MTGSAPLCFPFWELRELSVGLGKGRAGLEAAMVQAAVTAVQYWKVYLLTDTSSILSISLIKVSL